MSTGDDERLSRRRFIASGAAVAGAAAGWRAVGPVPSAARGAQGAAGRGPGAPAGFPGGIAVAQKQFQNWAQAITVDGVWTCAPRTGEEVVAAVNWARRHGYRVRALGQAPTWSPLALSGGPSRAGRG